MTEASDSNLVALCKRELPYRTRAFEMLVNRYKDRVFGKVLGMVGNREEAEEVCQDVFVKVFRGLPGFRGESSFSTWLYSITVNTCLNHLDRRKRGAGW